MTIEAQLDTIAQHLSEIKRLLATAIENPRVEIDQSLMKPRMDHLPPFPPKLKEDATTPEPEVTTDTDTDITPDDYRNVTLDDCIAMATQIVKSADDGSGVVKLKAIMKNIGTEKVSLLKPSQFTAFMRAAKGA